MSTEQLLKDLVDSTVPFGDLLPGARFVTTTAMATYGIPSAKEGVPPAIMGTRHPGDQNGWFPTLHVRDARGEVQPVNISSWPIEDHTLVLHLT